MNVLIYGTRIFGQVTVRFLAVASLVVLNGTVSAVFGEWPKHFIDSDLFRSTYVCAADIDGDGDLDVAVTAYQSNLVVWFENGGDDLSWRRDTIDANLGYPHGVHVADMDGDSDMDVVVAAASDNSVVWYENDGGKPIRWTKGIIDDNLYQASWVNGADIDGDGDVDVVGSNYFGSALYLYQNNGGSPVTWSRHLIGTGGFARFADMDGDMDLDVITGVVGQVVWYENGGGLPISWTGHIIDAKSGRDFNQIRVGDIDGDTDLDVAVNISSENSVVWYENGGDNLAWTEHVIDVSLVLAAGMDLVDIDGDADLDVVAAGHNANAVVWYVNSLPDTNWTRLSIDSSLYGPRNVETADLGGDGDLDVLVVGQLANDVVWYENAPVTSVDCGSPVLAGKYYLRQNYPNPFNPVTTIHYQLPRRSHVVLRIYNTLGQEVATLVNSLEEPGDKSVQWNAVGVASGVYFYRLQAGSFVQTRKLVVLR